MIIKNRISLIAVAAIIIITVFLGYLWITGIIPKGLPVDNVSVHRIPEFKDVNMSLNKLPPETYGEIRTLERKNSFTLDKWEFKSAKSSEINLYAHDIRNESAINALQGKIIGNYTIQIIHDTEFEAIRADVEQQLAELKKIPDYHISRIGMVTDTNIDPAEHNVELWVDMSTPENKKLDNTVIKGWKIHVYPMSRPPTTQRTKISSSNTSS
jgi:hypothetical protein